MSTLTIQLPESLRKSIEALAAKEGYSVSQFLVSAAGEKLAVMLTMDYLRREASAGRREDFERYLAAVPDTEPELNVLMIIIKPIPVTPTDPVVKSRVKRLTSLLFETHLRQDILLHRLSKPTCPTFNVRTGDLGRQRLAFT